MPKPIVHYTSTPNDFIVLGNRAHVWPIDHTSDLVTNQYMVSTSEVILIRKTDNKVVSFETRNTLYVAVEPRYEPS